MIFLLYNTVTSQTAGDYRSSVSSGNWSAVGSWEYFDGSAWTAASVSPASGSTVTITIRDGHSITMDNANYGNSGNNIIVESNATLSYTSATAFNFNSLIVYGLFVRNGSCAIPANKATIKSTGVYRHNINAGSIPTITWEQGSTLEFTGITTSVPTATGTYQNVIWNCQSQSGAIELNANLNNINGNFTIESTGSSYLALQTTTNRTMNIGGNLTIESGTLYGTTSSSSTYTPTFNIGGDFIMSGGTFNGSFGTSSKPVLNIEGGLSVSENAIFRAYNQSTSGEGFLQINFTNTNSQNNESELVIPNGLDRLHSKWSINIKSGRTIILGGDLEIGTTNNSSSQNMVLTVENGGTINFGTYILKNSSGTYTSGYEPRFTLASGGTIITANPNGITTSGSSGSVQLTGTRTYSSTGHYVYRGSVLQSSGNALTAASTVTVDNLAGLRLSLDVSISSKLYFFNGMIDAASNSRTVTITSTAEDAIQGYSSDNFIIGKLCRKIPASLSSSGNYIFPVGKATYHLLEMFEISTSSSGTVDITVECFEQGPAGATFSSPILGLDSKYWSVARSNVYFTSSKYKLLSGGLSNTDVISYCATVNGLYNSIGGSVSGNYISSSSTASNGFLCLGITEESDNDSEIISPTTQITAGNIYSDYNLQSLAVSVFNFKIEDNGSGDNKPTMPTQIVIKKNAGNLDLDDFIAGAQLVVGSSVIDAEATIETSQIVFEINSGSLIIPDGEAKQVTMQIWLKDNLPCTYDDETVSFKITASSHEAIANTFSSTFANEFTANIISNTITIKLITYSFSSTYTCNIGDWNGSLTVPVDVNCLPESLGGNIQLIRVDIEMGNLSDDTRNFYTYNLKLRSPDDGSKAYTEKTVFSTGFFPNATANIFNVKVRDHNGLAYPSSGSGAYAQPWHIGYYRTASVNIFSDFNATIDPNGTWNAVITETSASTGAAFKKVTLHFGASATFDDLTDDNSNNLCDAGLCIDSDHIYMVTNVDFTPQTGDPYDATTTGCVWNSARNKSAWFKFVPAATSMTLTISGLTDRLQAIVLVIDDDDICTPANYVIVHGGCAKDIVNDTYPNRRYSNGSSDNMQFVLTNLDPTKTYYLVLDGEGHNTSDFYVEVKNASSGCSKNTLPVELSHFAANCENETVIISWRTESEINNKCFDLEKSYDRINWRMLERIPGAEYSVITQHYTVVDNEKNSEAGSYYRLRQIDFDGTESVSKLVFAQCNNSQTEGFIIYPNPSVNEIFISSLNQTEELKCNVKICDSSGKILLCDDYQYTNIFSINIEKLLPGFYLIIIEQKGKIFNHRLIKL